MATRARDLYETLGVPKKASEAEIKKAYRKLAREFHPDKNPGDAAAEERFKEIQGAYDVLGDPKKRKQYDQVGPSMFGGGGGRRTQTSTRNVNWTGNIGDLGDLGDLGDVLGGLFGNRGRGGGRAGGARPGGARRRGRGERLLRGLAPRDHDADPGRDRDRLRDLQGLGGRAGDGADRLPRMPRPRRRLGEPGPLRALAAVPALRRQRHRRSRSRAVPAAEAAGSGRSSASR